MRRKILLLGVFMLIAAPLLAGGTVSAQFDPFGNACAEEGANSEVCEASKNTENPVSGSSGVLVTVLNILSFMVGVASVLMIILGGLKYVLSNGDNNAVSNAKNTILYAIIGLVAFLSSQLIIRFVISKL